MAVVLLRVLFESGCDVDEPFLAVWDVCRGATPREPWDFVVARPCFEIRLGLFMDFVEPFETSTDAVRPIAGEDFVFFSD